MATKGLDYDEMRTAVSRDNKRFNRFSAEQSLSLQPGRINFLAPNAALPQPKHRTSLRRMGLLVLVAATVVATLA